MKKILFVLLALMFCASLGYAEQSAQTYSGNSTQSYREQQVFIDCYNNSGSSISSNYVVIVDTSTTLAASGSTLGTYINTTTTANDTRWLGVTDQTIANGSVGRVCIRGPHKCYLSGLAGAAAGATLATTTTAGAGDMSSSTTKGGEFGILLHTGVIANSTSGFNSGDGTSNYWVWIGKK